MRQNAPERVLISFFSGEACPRTPIARLNGRTSKVSFRRTCQKEYCPSPAIESTTVENAAMETLEIIFFVKN